MLDRFRVLFISLIITVAHLTVVGFTATTSEATSPVYLKSEKEVSVRANQVWLSDIFHNIPFESDTVIATTPALGKKFIFRYRDLKTINETLWDIEDDIRDEERARNFGEKFIELARSVYVTNDQRADAKKKLNIHLGSTLVEEKSYQDYQ